MEDPVGYLDEIQSQLTFARPTIAAAELPLGARVEIDLVVKARPSKELKPYDYTFHIVYVFSAKPFAGNQLAILPDAAGISTEGMRKIAREFNFGETTLVLPKKGPSGYRDGRR